MNKNQYAAETLRREIYHMVETHNQLVKDGNAECVDVEEYLPYLNLEKVYDKAMLANLK